MPVACKKAFADDGVAKERDQGERERQAKAQVVDQRSDQRRQSEDKCRISPERQLRVDVPARHLEIIPVEFDDDGRCRKRNEKDREHHSRQHCAQPPDEDFTQDPEGRRGERENADPADAERAGRGCHQEGACDEQHADRQEDVVEAVQEAKALFVGKDGLAIGTERRTDVLRASPAAFRLAPRR